MQTVLLAAGQGTRMRPLTDHVPKPMLPVAGKPLLAHTATAAVEAGASRLVIVVGYEADIVTDYVGDELAGVPVTFVTQSEQRGTAHALRAAEPELDDEPFAVLNGDALYDVASLTSLYDRGPAVGSYRVDNPHLYGVLVTDQTGSRLVDVVEKPGDPPSNQVNTGAYVFPAAARDLLAVEESERGEQELTDVLAQVCAQTAVAVVPFDNWLDVGRPWELLEANEWQLGDRTRSIEGDVHADARVRGAVAVEDGASVDAGAVVSGPAYLASGVTVGPNAYVRGATYLASDVHIGHGVEIKNSVVGEGTAVAHLSYVGDSVVGRDVNIGAGTNVANLRHDDQPVSMVVRGAQVSTGRQKFGVVIGDGARTGVNTSLNPGVTLPSNATTMPGETVFQGDDESSGPV